MNKKRKTQKMFNNFYLYLNKIMDGIGNVSKNGI